jgi:hypothetical protein
MFRDNVVWVDFRISKDIRDKQVLSFAERMRSSSARTRGHVEASKTSLKLIKLWFDDEKNTRGRIDKD